MQKHGAASARTAPVAPHASARQGAAPPFQFTLSVLEAGRCLGVSARTVRAMLRRNELTPIRSPAGGRARVSVVSLWLALGTPAEAIGRALAALAERERDSALPSSPRSHGPEALGHPGESLVPIVADATPRQLAGVVSEVPARRRPRSRGPTSRRSAIVLTPRQVRAAMAEFDRSAQAPAPGANGGSE